MAQNVARGYPKKVATFFKKKSEKKSKKTHSPRAFFIGGKKKWELERKTISKKKSKKRDAVQACRCVDFYDYQGCHGVRVGVSEESSSFT
jgi:hypothetical protein